MVLVMPHQKMVILKIEQLGGLIIKSNVEIGAGCTIDRGALGNTEIHDGVKLDNQVHIAHNVILRSRILQLQLVVLLLALQLLVMNSSNGRAFR